MDHLPDGFDAVPEIEVTTSAPFPPSVRDPDIVVVRDHVFDQRSADDQFLAYHLEGELYRRVAALDGDRIQRFEPIEMEFAVDVLTGR